MNISKSFVTVVLGILVFSVFYLVFSSEETSGTGQFSWPFDLTGRPKARMQFTHTECFVNAGGVGYCKDVSGPGQNECSLSNSFNDCNKLACNTTTTNLTEYNKCGYTFGTGSDLDGCSSFGQECGTPSNGTWLVFVTDNTTNGSIGSNAHNTLFFADRMCNDEADLLGYPGKYNAWISTPFVNAIDRISDGVYYNVYNEIIDYSKQDLITVNPGQSFYYILNAIGPFVPFPHYTWTGTNEDGTSTGFNCNNWTSSASDNFYVTVGYTKGTHSSWTNLSFGAYCDDQLHLYCFQVDN
jgi:hypothetical protein